MKKYYSAPSVSVHTLTIGSILAGSGATGEIDPWKVRQADNSLQTKSASGWSAEPIKESKSIWNND